MNDINDNIESTNQAKVKVVIVPAPVVYGVLLAMVLLFAISSAILF